MKRVFVIIPLIAVLILAISFLAGWHLTNAQTKVSKEEILRVLSSTDFSKAESSQTLIKRIKDRGGVDFTPTNDILAQFRTNGATEDLIKAIQENSPKLTLTPTPERQTSTPTPTPTSAPRSGEESLSVDQIISVLNNPKESITGRNIFLAKIIKRRGVDFDSTSEIEEKLTANKANKALIALIRISGPNSTPPIDPKAPTIVKNSIGMDLVLVKAGSFSMGTKSPKKIMTKDADTIDDLTLAREDESFVRRVTIKEPFYMGRTEVTQAQWEAVMKTTIRDLRNKKYPNSHTDPDEFLSGNGANYPIYYVSWRDAKEFVKRLNALNDGYEYRLPSEAEWEYACRAETTGDYAGKLDDMSWYANNSGIEYRDSDVEWEKANSNSLKYQNDFVIPNKNGAHEVGTKKTNKFGLHDMHGNVWEWCEDIYSSSYEGLPTDGSPNEVLKDVETRVMRGGSWKDPYPSAEFQRSAYRLKYSPDYYEINIGFRVAARPK